MKDHGVLWRVGRPDGHDVALANAGASQACGEPAGLIDELSVGEHAASRALDQGRGVATGGGAPSTKS